MFIKIKFLFLLLVTFPVMLKAQEIPHTWLFEHGVKKTTTHIIDTVENSHFSSITTVDHANRTITKKTMLAGYKDTVTETTQYNQLFKPTTVHYVSPDVNTTTLYTYLPNDSSEVMVRHTSQILRRDSVIYENASEYTHKTIYKKHKQVRYIYQDGKLSQKVVSKTKGNTKTILYKKFDRNNGIHPTKEIQVNKGTDVFSTVWYYSPEPRSCTKMTVHRQKLLSKIDVLMELTVTTDYCGKKTYRYRYVYFY